MKNKNRRNHEDETSYFVRASVYYLLLVSVIAVRTAFARMFSLCIASVCAHAISAPLCLWFCLVLFSSVSHLGVCPVVCHLAAECCRVVVLVGRGLVLVRCEKCLLF